MIRLFKRYPLVFRWKVAHDGLWTVSNRRGHTFWLPVGILIETRDDLQCTSAYFWKYSLTVGHVAFIKVHPPA